MCLYVYSKKTVSEKKENNSFYIQQLFVCRKRKDMSKKNHKCRVRQRNHSIPKKAKKNIFLKQILICISIVIFLFICFNLLFVSRKKVETSIQVQNIQLVSNGGTNKYLQYNKRGSSWISINYPAIYKITAETDEGEIICFEFVGDAYKAFPYKEKYNIEYEVRSIFNNTKILFKKKKDTWPL